MTGQSSAENYTRLPGRGRRLAARFVTGEAQRLYVTDTHFFVLRRVGYEETSKRYALNDIQAITVQSNNDRTIVSTSLMLVMMGFAAIGFVAVGQGVDPADVPMFILYGVVGIFGFFLALDLALGSTCTARLHTAVQIEELTALRRMRTARRCLAILVPRIEAAQGAPMPALADLTARASANAKEVREKKPPTVIGRTLHAWAFAANAVLGATSIVELLYEGAAKDRKSVV